MRLHESLVVKVAYLITGDAELARDAAQEAFLRAYLKIRSLRDPAAFKPWLTRIVSTIAQRMAKREKRRWTYPLDESTDRASLEPLPAEVCEWRDLHQRLEQALASLSPVHRATIALSAFGHSDAEIAQILGCPRGTVKSRLHFARRQLRRSLGDKQGWETVL